MAENAYSRARAAWFADAERRRVAAKLPPHKRAPDTPAPPLSPDELRWMLHEAPTPVGSRALRVLQIDRSTLSRWLTGASVVPHSAALVLRQLAEGIPPNGSDHWRGFRFDREALITPAGERVPARRIESLGMVYAQVDALQRHVKHLEGVIESLRRVGDSANDAVTDVACQPTAPLSSRAAVGTNPPPQRPIWRRPPQ